MRIIFPSRLRGSSPVLVEQMTREEYRDQVSRRIIILPLGSLEQHGHHLPPSVDVVIPSSPTKMACVELDAMVLPPIVHGCKAQGGGQRFLGFVREDRIIDDQACTEQC